jgi:hypothetical protein
MFEGTMEFFFSALSGSPGPYSLSQTEKNEALLQS